MKRKFFLFLLLICFGFFTWAQTKQVSGRVTKQGTTENLTGVTVTVKGTSTITTTNTEGHYTIIVPGNNSVLVFSSVGYATQELNVGDRTTVDVAFAEQTSTLEEVVMTGYGSGVRRGDLTSAVSSLKGKDLRDNPLSSAAEALQGRLAGVQAISSEGVPGGDVIIRVRGGGSITQDNSPLYIVDGVQVENALSVIAPQDIASIDVLKDASSTAIYGARAANGVFIITTKAGRPGKTQINYNGSFGWRELPKTMDVLSPYDFVVWQYERSRGNVADSTSFARTYGTTWDTLNVYKNTAPVNWQEEVFGRRASYSNHNVSVNGGGENTSFNLSLTGNKEDGIL